MTFRRRILFAALVAVVISGGLMSLVFLLPSGTTPEILEATREGAAPIASESATRAPSVEAPGPRAEETSDPPKAPIPPEPLIEDLLAEDGEDPGAVYYMSRVREAVREGNPAFGRELLRQMKEEHSSSVLIEEAEALFVSGR